MEISWPHYKVQNKFHWPTTIGPGDDKCHLRNTVLRVTLRVVAQGGNATGYLLCYHTAAPQSRCSQLQQVAQQSTHCRLGTEAGGLPLYGISVYLRHYGPVLDETYQLSGLL